MTKKAKIELVIKILIILLLVPVLVEKLADSSEATSTSKAFNGTVDGTTSEYRNFANVTTDVNSVPFERQSSFNITRDNVFDAANNTTVNGKTFADRTFYNIVVKELAFTQKGRWPYENENRVFCLWNGKHLHDSDYLDADNSGVRVANKAIKKTDYWDSATSSDGTYQNATKHYLSKKLCNKIKKFTIPTEGLQSAVVQYQTNGLTEVPNIAQGTNDDGKYNTFGIVYAMSFYQEGSSWFDNNAQYAIWNYTDGIRL